MVDIEAEIIADYWLGFPLDLAFRSSDFFVDSVFAEKIAVFLEASPSGKIERFL